MNKILEIHYEDLNIWLEAKTVEEALIGLVVYLNNGIKILNAIVDNFDDKIN